MILVTGATGRVGYRLMEALADARADVTAMVRVEAEAADLPGNPEHVIASLDDPPPASVLRQFDRVFLLSHEIEEQVELLLERGRTAWQADGDLERFAWIAGGGADTVTGTVRELTGSGPRPIEEWLADERETFDAPL